MSEFKVFKDAVKKQLDLMLVMGASKLFLTDVDKDALWETYLNSYPEGTNNVYRERREYDCSACKQFIRPYANLVTIVNNQLISIWDVDVPEPYKTVAKTMSDYVKSKPVKDYFVTKFAQLGVDRNHEETPNGIITWEHFAFAIPVGMVDRSHHSVEAIQGTIRTNKEVFKRALSEISLDAVDTVLELIAQKSLYRGEESQGAVQRLRTEIEAYNKIPEKDQDNYIWSKITTVNPSSIHIRNSAIGTLLCDISEGRDLDEAVAAFERIMAPANYKRPNAIYTKAMIEKAQKALEEAGLMPSLGRRFATKDDITVNNVLYANRNVKKPENVFDEMMKDTKINSKSFNKVENVTIDDFIANILPTATSIELFLENHHNNNLMSLIAPTDPLAPALFKWDNNFSWSYNGNLTDSIKEKVKTAGGRVEGALRVSLNWYNLDDLDIHVIEPNGFEICFRNLYSHKSQGTLDVDMNVSNPVRDAVENVIWPNKTLLQEGTYKVFVNNYTKRDTSDVGFTVELEYDGQIHTFTSDKSPGNSQNISVVSFKYSKKDGIKFIENIPSTVTSKEMWGLKTQQFHPVSMMLLSPNHWDDKTVGNKHFFFILEGALNNEPARGFFNEFLKEEFNVHRKVFEALGNKMKVEPSSEQLSGLGFSSTQKTEVICRVHGAFTRTIKIIF